VLDEDEALVADAPEVTREAMLLPEDGGSVVLARVGVVGGAGLDSEGGMAKSVGATLAGRSGAPACTGGAVYVVGAHVAGGDATYCVTKDSRPSSKAA
jgi:hypothetical protein